MKFIFFGTPRFASIVLEELISRGFAPSLVITNPDRPSGRKKILTPPPVKVLALEHDIKVLQPESLDISHLEFDLKNFDFAVVAAYSKILKKDILEMPRLGTIGVHPSLLPALRGASPIQSAILDGDIETGVTLYLMDEKVDHGSILRQVKSDSPRWPASPSLGGSDGEAGKRQGDTYLALEERLARLSGDLLAKTIPDFASGKIVPQPQNHTQATFTKKFKTEDARVDFVEDNPQMIERKIRALNPEPGVWTMNFPKLEGKRVKLLKAEYNNQLTVLEIQIEGRKPQKPHSRFEGEVLAPLSSSGPANREPEDPDLL